MRKDNFIQELGKLMFAKYSQSYNWISEVELQVEYDEENTPFQLNTTDIWRIVVRWEDNSCNKTTAIHLVEIIPNDFDAWAENYIDVATLSKGKQQKLFDFISNVK